MEETGVSTSTVSAFGNHEVTTFECDSILLHERGEDVCEGTTEVGDSVLSRTRESPKGAG